MRENDWQRESEPSETFFEFLREEAILAALDPDRLGDETPPGVPADEWAEFVALYERTYPET